MEEHINEILEVSENRTTNEKNREQTTDYSAEKTLKTMSEIVLYVGIITTFICLITLTTTKTYLGHDEFNPMGLVYSILVLFSSLVAWSCMNVFANISISLKKINEKTK